MINEHDELPHDAPTDTPARWQENFFIIAWSIDDGAGVLLHCKRWPATGKQVARLVACTPGRMVSRRVEEPIPDQFAVDGLSLLVDEPFRSLRLKGGFAGTEGVGPLGFIALRGAGDTEVHLDLRLTSALAPADFAEGFALLASSFDATREPPAFEDVQQHYEQGGRCEGSITVDGTTVVIDGLFVRDHTWGPREESSISDGAHGFWTATTLDEGNLYFNATGLVTESGVHGIGVVVDKDGQSTTSAIEVEFSPVAGLHGFDQTAVRIGGDKPIDATGDVQLHLVKYLPGSGPRRFDDNGIARVDAGGSTGFGVHEYAGALTPAQAHDVESGEA